MYKISRATTEYLKGLEEFITCDVILWKKPKGRGNKRNDLMSCHDFNNFKRYHSADTVWDHLCRRGSKEGYVKWIWHVERVHSRRTSSIKRGREEDNMMNNDEEDVNIDRVEEMIQDMEDHFM